MTAGRRALAVASTAYALASCALGIVGVVVAVALFDRTGSAGWATAGAVVRVAPFVVFSAVAGALVGRWPARAALIGATVGVGLAAVALAVTVESAPLVAVAAAGFVAHLAWTVAYPAIASMVPRLVGPDELASANGVVSTVESLAWIAGPGLGGVAIAVLGPTAASVLGAVFAGLAVGVWSLVPTVSAAGSGPAGAGVVDQIRRGAASLRPVAGAVALQLVGNLVFGALGVLLLIAATERLGFGDGGYGLLTAAMAAGSFVALGVVGRLGAVSRPIAPLAAAVLLAGAPIGALAVVGAPSVALVLVAVGGLGAVLVDVLALTILQRQLPPSALASVLGLLDSMTVGVILLGSVVAGPLVGAVGLERALVLVGGVLPAAGLLATPTFRLRHRDPVSLAGAAQLGVALPMLAMVRPAGSAVGDVLARALPDPSAEPDAGRDGDEDVATEPSAGEVGAEVDRPAPVDVPVVVDPAVPVDVPVIVAPAVEGPAEHPPVDPSGTGDGLGEGLPHEAAPPAGPEPDVAGPPAAPGPRPPGAVNPPDDVPAGPPTDLADDITTLPGPPGAVAPPGPPVGDGEVGDGDLTAPAGPTPEPVASEPVPEPDVPGVADRVVDPSTDPFADPVADPVVDPWTDPMADPLADPFVDPVPDPLGDLAARAPSDPGAHDGDMGRDDGLEPPDVVLGDE